MARPTTPMKQTRTQAYKDEALALAERIGVSKAAEQLGLHASQLYSWRSKRQQSQTSSEREQSLADENARLKRLLAEQAEELAIVKIYGHPRFCNTDQRWVFGLPKSIRRPSGACPAPR